MTRTSTKDIVRRRKEHFEELLNPTDMLEQSGGSEPISIAEVTQVVGELLNDRASGVDEIRPEMLKALDVVGRSLLKPKVSHFFSETNWQLTVHFICEKNVSFLLRSVYRGGNLSISYLSHNYNMAYRP